MAVMEERGVEPFTFQHCCGVPGIKGLGVVGIILCCFDFSETRLMWAGQPCTSAFLSAGVTGVTHHAACHSEGW